jgi:hypothetical protein
VSGTLDVKWGIRFTPLVRYQSGIPFAPTFTARLNYANVPIEAAPYGSARNPNTTIVDLRGEKYFTGNVRKLGSTKFGLFLDLYNIFNANSAQSATQTYGPAYLRPITIVGPRMFRVGARFSF